METATPQPVTGVLDTLKDWEAAAAKLTPGALLADLREAQATIKAYEDRIAALEADLQTALTVLRAGAKRVLPILVPLLALEGITIPPEILALLEAASPAPGPQPVGVGYPAHPLATGLTGDEMAGEHLQG